MSGGGGGGEGVSGGGGGVNVARVVGNARRNRAGGVDGGILGPSSRAAGVES